MRQPALVLVLSMSTSGILAEAQPNRLSAGDVVRRTVANELKAANAPGHYMYRMRVQKPRETQLKEIVETKDWLIGRLIQVNGKPLTAKQERKEQERKEQERVARLLDDESLRRQESKDQQENECKVRDLLRALPDAFLYQYVYPEPGKTPATLERLSFKPNPQFHSQRSDSELHLPCNSTQRHGGHKTMKKHM